MPYLSALAVCSRQGAIQINVYLYFTLPNCACTMFAQKQKSTLKLKLKTNLYSAIKSEDSEALDGGTSWHSAEQPEGVW